MDEIDLKRIIEIQLDRKINNYQRVLKSCPFNFPAVILVNPYKNKIPAPTIYWLSCPDLNYKVDRLEAETDLIDKLADKIKKDKKFKKAVKTSHQNYAAKRQELLTAEQLKMAEEISFDLYDSLLNSGVGGIRDQKGVKCLHTHLADYLINKKNPIGKIVHKLVKWPQKCNICQERIDRIESSSN